MRTIRFSKHAAEDQARCPARHRRRIAAKIFHLALEPCSEEAHELAGYPYQWASVGEYRIVGRVLEDVVYIIRIGRHCTQETDRQP